MPKIVDQDAVTGTRGSEKQFLMSSKDVDSWMKIESLLVRAAEVLKLRFGNSATQPSSPSFLGFTDVFTSVENVKSAIIASRNSFILWMGFLSYIIAQSESQNIQTSKVPCWHQHLLDNEFSPPWLDGLVSSSVCSYNIQTPRAGVVLRWIYDDVTRPNIEWFYTHNIPLFFIWSRNEENLVSSCERFAHLRPPNHLLQQALSFLWKAPNMPIADLSLVMRRFYQLEKTELNIAKVQVLATQSTSSCMQVVIKTYLEQQCQPQQDPPCTVLDTQDCQADAQLTAMETSHLPFQTMLEMDEGERGKLYDSFKEFFSAREKRQAELLKVESNIDRQ